MDTFARSHQLKASPPKKKTKRAEPQAEQDESQEAHQADLGGCLDSKTGADEQMGIIFPPSHH